jgi:serine/threonine-protein kinase
MGPEASAAHDRESLVNLAIYDYHAAIDRGESPDPAEWAARNPEIAAELHAYFDDLARLGLLPPATRADPLGATASLGRRDHPGPESQLPRQTADLRPGDVLGDYVLLEKLGEGGQGVVWKARPKNSREIVVALKTLRGPASGDLASVHRLRADARAIARMKHDNIIRTFYFGEDRGRWFFVMELMDGGTVADRLESYRADPRAAAVLMERVARAIHHAHSRNPGVLHLDIKPGNILLDADGEPRVTDFGLSMRLETIDPSEEGPPPEHPGEPDDADVLSATFARTSIVGTLPFMSPEMAGGRWSDVSMASDVYGLGAVLFTMLTGREPFRGQNARETLALILRGDLPSPRALNPNVDRELNAICLRCLDREPGRRYGSADALANDLRRWLDRRPTLAGGKPSAVREARFWARRHPLGLAAMGVVVLLLWLIDVAVSVTELRAENVREAARLASQVDRELRLIRRATQILASDPRLRGAFTAFPAPDQAARRRGAIEAFLKTAVEGERLFGIAGGNPFVNIFVLEPDGVMVADSVADSRAVGQSFAVRDYYRAFFEPGVPRPRDEVYVARSFRSLKDGRYKIAISTRVWGDRGDLLGILVANFAIGPRLIDVDLRHEPDDAAVLCLMDHSDPAPSGGNRRPAWPYIAVLDRQYAGSAGDQPATFGASLLPDFQGDATLSHASGGPWGGRFVDYHRVGQTHMVVVLRRPCPWPLSWLPEFR